MRVFNRIRPSSNRLFAICFAPRRKSSCSRFSVLVGAEDLPSPVGSAKNDMTRRTQNATKFIFLPHKRAQVIVHCHVLPDNFSEPAAGVRVNVAQSFAG